MSDTSWGPVGGRESSLGHALSLYWDPEGREEPVSWGVKMVGNLGDKEKGRSPLNCDFVFIT